MHYQPVFIVAVSLVTLLSIYRIVRSDGPRWYMVSVGIMRVLAGLFLIIAFIEPVVSIQRLPDPDRPVPVLVDASKSMALFPVDSIIRRFRSAAESPGTGGQKRRFTWYLFGDSLRACDDLSTYQSSDKKSTLPETGSSAGLLDADELVVISDANWTNPSPVTSSFSSKSVWYIPLSPSRLPPFLVCRAPDTINTSAGSPFRLSLSLRGNLSAPSVITVTAAENKKESVVDTCMVAAGRFSRQCLLELPAPLPGLHIYRITAAASSDSLTRTEFVCNHAVTSAFTCTVFSEEPSLDARFIRLALARNSELSLLRGKSGRSSADIAFFIGPGRPPAASMPLSGLSVFLGCLPGSTIPVRSSKGFHFFIPDSHPSPFAQLPLEELPPVTEMVQNPSVHPVEPYISCALSGDTLPVLFRGTYRGRELIACTFTGFWKWDFLTLSHTLGEADMFSFSRRLVSVITSTMHSMQTDTLLLFPNGTPAEGSPGDFSCILPALVGHSGRSQLRCSVTGPNGIVTGDTVLELFPTTALFQKITLPALSAGSHTVRCTLVTADTSLAAETAFPVYPDNTEMLVEGQNEHLLREIGQPLDIDSIRSSVLFSPRSDGYLSADHVTETFPITRTWWLLSALFLLFGTEWILRRVAEFD